MLVGRLPRKHLDENQNKKSGDRHEKYKGPARRGQSIQNIEGNRTENNRQRRQKRENRIGTVQQLGEEQQHCHDQHMADIDSGWIG